MLKPSDIKIINNLLVLKVGEIEPERFEKPSSKRAKKETKEGKRPVGLIRNYEKSRTNKIV
jgi:hypothetical protein